MRITPMVVKIEMLATKPMMSRMTPRMIKTTPSVVLP